MKPSFVLLGFLIGSLQAEIVLWRAAGTISATTGTFEDSSLPPGEAVSIRMTYDDRALPDKPYNQSIGLVDTDYRTNVNLAIQITIGDHTWQGAVETGAGGTPSAVGTLPPPYTLVTKLRSFATNEEFEAQIHSGDLGDFDKFPFQVEGALSIINLNFKGPNTFLGIGIESLEVTPSLITTATGSISSGASQLRFDINPSSVEVLDLAQVPVSPAIHFSTQGDDVRINWRSSSFFSYRIERSLTLDDDGWTTIEAINGTGAAFTRQYPRGESPEFYRIVTDTKSQ